MTGHCSGRSFTSTGLEEALCLIQSKERKEKREVYIMCVMYQIDS